MDAKTKDAVNRLEDLMKEAKRLSKTDSLFARETVSGWLNEALFEVTDICGSESTFLYSIKSAFETAAGDLDAEDERYRKGLKGAMNTLDSLVNLLEKHGIQKVRAVTDMGEATSSNIFISHGPREDTTGKIADYVGSLGLNPVLVKDSASGGAGVDRLVKEKMKETSSMIVVLTKDARNEMGEWIPAGNVSHEVGLAEEILHGRIIYLVEEGCTLPSNYRNKRWQSFSSETIIEDTCYYINKELLSFGNLGGVRS